MSGIKWWRMSWCRLVVSALAFIESSHGWLACRHLDDHHEQRSSPFLVQPGVWVFIMTYVFCYLDTHFLLAVVSHLGRKIYELKHSTSF